MRAATAYVTAALVLLVVGSGLWMMGRLDQRVAAARRLLLTLDYDAPLGEYDRVERSVAYLSQLPWTRDLAADVRAQRATSKYWRSDYASLAIEQDPKGGSSERETSILLLAANAAFRRSRLDGGDRSAQRLNAILERYAEVLRREPQRFDAAYNYEVVVRAREGLTRTRSGGATTKGEPAATAPTIHGRPGGQPPGTDTREFKVLVPQRSDERRQQPEAGKGGAKIRKG